MDENSAKTKSLEDIISLMDGHMMKGYQSKLPKPAAPELDATMSEETTTSPAELFEASGAEAPASGEPEMDDETMQQLMKMYEEDEFVPGQPSVPVTGVN